MKKVLITGGAGFIGYHLTKRLLKERVEVVIADNFVRGVKDTSLEELEASKFCSIHNLDLTSSLPEREQFDTIFHFAAIIGVQHVLKRPFKVLQCNFQLLDNLIDYARRIDGLQRFVFASTSEVYAGTLKHFDLTVPTPESVPLALTDLREPRTSYMLSKIYGEALCLQSGLPATIVRPHNIYGPRMGMSHVIPELLQRSWKATEGETLDVYSVEHRRSFCYIDDAVEMLIRMARSESCKGKVLNLCRQGPELTMLEVAKTVLQVQEKTLRINPLPPTPGSPSRRAPDVRRTSELIDFDAKVGLEEGIQRTFDWYLKHIFQNEGVSAS
jgi:UDP-glucose 4-epimerase